MDIRKNEITGGQCCVFQKNGEYFYADRSFTFDAGMETMIFPYDKEIEEVSDWGDLYCDRTGKSLKECIEEFLSW